MKTDDTQALHALQTLSGADPDYAAFAADRRALADIALDAGEEIALGRELLAALRESPEHAARVDAILQAPSPPRFDGGAASVPILLAAVFLLRSDIEVKRDKQGRWSFKWLHKPARSELMKKLVDKISGFLS